MLRIEFGHLILLAVLLLPGVVSGTLVSWKIRSPLALFFTIGSSLASSFTVSLLGLLLWQLISPFVAHLSSHSLVDIRSESLPWFLAPTGLITGATLSGMLLLVNHELKRSGKKFNFSSAIVAGISSSVVGSIISLLSLIAISLTTTFLLRFLGMFFKYADMGLAAIGIIIYGVLALLSILLCGLISAIFGIKLARFLK
jgi:hypothetical protein